MSSPPPPEPAPDLSGTDAHSNAQVADKKKSRYGAVMCVMLMNETSFLKGCNGLHACKKCNFAFLGSVLTSFALLRCLNAELLRRTHKQPSVAI